MGYPMIENVLEVGHPTPQNILDGMFYDCKYIRVGHPIPKNIIDGMSYDCNYTRGGTSHTIKYTRWDVSDTWPVYGL
jgi:hypothetical protein